MFSIESEVDVSKQILFQSMFPLCFFVCEKVRIWILVLKIPDCEKILIAIILYDFNIDINGWDLAEWVERLAVNAEVTTVLGSIPASSDAVESEGRQMKQCWIEKKFIQIPLILPVLVFGHQILDASQKKYLGKLCGLVLAGGSGAGKTTICRYRIYSVNLQSSFGEKSLKTIVNLS